MSQRAHDKTPEPKTLRGHCHFILLVRIIQSTVDLDSIFLLYCYYYIVGQAHVLPAVCVHLMYRHHYQINTHFTRALHGRFTSVGVAILIPPNKWPQTKVAKRIYTSTTLPIWCQFNFAKYSKHLTNWTHLQFTCLHNNSRCTVSWLLEYYSHSGYLIRISQ